MYLKDILILKKDSILLNHIILNLKTHQEINVSFELPHGPDLIQEMYFRANIKINHYINNLSSIKLFSSNQLIIELPYTEYTTNQIKK